MTKEEYKDAYKDYDKPIISHTDEEYDAMKDYEWSIMHHSDDYDNDDNYDGCIHHFQD